MSSISVIGLVEPTQVLEDIGCDVPRGVVVTIPADLAYRSKDLWRALSQNRIFQVGSRSVQGDRPIVSSPVDLESLRTENQNLKTQVEELRNENETLRKTLEANATQKSQLDEILALVKDRPAATGIPQAPQQSQPKSSVSGDAPLFIPDSIRPKDVVSNMEVEREESQDSSISGASKKLKKLKSGSQ